MDTLVLILVVAVVLSSASKVLSNIIYEMKFLVDVFAEADLVELLVSSSCTGSRRWWACPSESSSSIVKFFIVWFVCGTKTFLRISRFVFFIFGFSAIWLIQPSLLRRIFRFFWVLHVLIRSLTFPLPTYLLPEDLEVCLPASCVLRLPKFRHMLRGVATQTSGTLESKQLQTLVRHQSLRLGRHQETPCKKLGNQKMGLNHQTRQERQETKARWVLRGFQDHQRRKHKRTAQHLQEADSD